MNKHFAFSYKKVHSTIFVYEFKILRLVRICAELIIMSNFRVNIIDLKLFSISLNKSFSPSIYM